MRVPLSLLVMAAVAVVGCGESEEQIIGRLDPVGRSMLDPLRLKALGVPELLDKLALQESSIVADIGAGPGFLTLPIAAQVPAGKVIATDIRPEYLDVLMRLARRASLENIEARLVHPDHPGLDPSSVDVALLVQVDHALNDRVAYFRELVPVLREGGRVVLVNYHRYREADLQALREAGLVVAEAWTASEAFFGLVAQKGQVE